MNTSTSKSAKDGGDPATLLTVTEVAEQVGREILESRLEPAAWATALYECDGRKQDALATYARLRVRKLSKQRRIRLAKVKSFESRRLAQCMGDEATRELLASTIQDMLHSTKRGQSLNFMKPRLSVLWLFILFLGSAGTIAALCRMAGSYFPGAPAHPPGLVAVIGGVVVVWCALLVRFLLPKRWIMLCWNSGLVMACNVVCLSSLFLGAKLIKQTVSAGNTTISVQRQSERKPASAVATSAKKNKADDPCLVTTRINNGTDGN